MVAIVYTAPGCHACDKAIQFLKSLNVDVKERDARLYPEVCTSVPLIQIGKITVMGFSISTLRRVVEAQLARESLTTN